jgi:hypothetical protein
VADDAEALHAVVQSIEGRIFQLTEPFGDDAAARREAPLEAVREADVEAVQEQMPSAKDGRVANEILDVEADRGVVRRDDGAGADADDRVDWHSVTKQLPQHAGVRGAAKAAGAQDQGDANRHPRGQRPHVSYSPPVTRPVASRSAQMDRYFGRDEKVELTVSYASARVVFTPRGRTFIDFNSGWCVGNLGWNHPRAATSTPSMATRLGTNRTRHREPSVLWPCK